MIGTAVVLSLALVLASAAAVKLRESVSPLAIGELALAGIAIVIPGAAAGILLAIVYATFAAAHVRRWRAGLDGCECFGADSPRGASALRATTLTAASAICSLVVGLTGAPSIVKLGGAAPGRASLTVLAAVIGASLWRVLFSLEAGAADRIAVSLARGSALALERGFTRRTALQRIALVGSALAVAPLRYLLYPGTALAAIMPSDCTDGLCTDGWTAFCCQITGGLNSCPEGTFAGGWWMCTDYAGSQLCAGHGLRYYVDCNALPGAEFPGGCQCAGGTCSERRVACNVFRYGQCNAHVAGVTAVVCRMVLCENPSTVPALGCSASLAVENAVCAQDAACLIPDALELAGAGGV